MDKLKRCHMSTLLYTVIVLCFSQTQEVVSAARPETANTFYVTKGRYAELPCWIGREQNGAFWFYTYVNLQGRDQTFYRDEFLILKISNVRLSDTGNYKCIKNAERSLVYLIVVDPSEPRVVRAKAQEATKLRVSWAAPRSSTEEVAGYKIYTSYTMDGVQKSKDYTIDEASSTKKESMVLEELEPGVEYEVKLSALYRDGPDGNKRIEGPVSQGVLETLPELPKEDKNSTDIDEPQKEDSNSEKSEPVDPKDATKPQNLVVIADGDSRLVVSWQLQGSPRPAELLGYNVAFQAKKKKAKKGKKRHLPASGELNATVPIEQTPTGSNWRVVIDRLKSKFQYVVTVTPILRTGFGTPAPSVTVLLEEPQKSPRLLSMRAIPLGPESVLITFKVQGKGRIAKTKLSYIEEGGTEWTKARVKFEATQKVVNGLKPKTTYFFHASTKLAKKTREAVTHVVTPPSDLPQPTDVRVQVQDSQSVLVKWRHDGAVDVMRYRITIEEKQQDGSFTLNQELTERGMSRSCEVDRLREDGQYRVKVTPYDFDGQGQASELVMFSLADHESIDNQDEASKPEFEANIPGHLNITRGGLLELVCTTRGTPNPDVAWYLNGETEPSGTPGAGRSTLEMDAVEGPFVAICVAKNSAGIIFSPVQVTVLDEPNTADATKPVFETDIPTQLTIAKGDMVNISCVAIGTPIPEVTWYVYDATEPTGATGAGRNNLALGPVEESIRVICVAQNSAGIIFAPVRVTVLDNSTDAYLEQLTFTSNLPSVIPVTFNGDVTLNCSAAGSPKPDVRWYKDGVLVAQAGQNELSALFHEVDVTTNFSVRCVVSNDHQLIAAEAKIFAQEPEIISVETYAIPMSSSNILVNWIVTQGDLNAISGFNATLFDQDGKQLVEVPLASSERSLPLDEFVPGTSFKFILKTLTTERVADEDVIDIDIELPEQSNVTSLHVDVVEVRENQVRVNLRVTGPDASLVTSYRLSIDQVTPRQNEQILTVDALHSSFVVQDLKPHRQYQLQVSAMSTDSKPVINQTVLFTTSTSGRSGSQVLSELTSKEIDDQEEEEKSCPECPVCPTQPAPTCGYTDQFNATATSTVTALKSTAVPRSSTTPVITTVDPAVSSLPPVVTTSTSSIGTTSSIAPETTPTTAAETTTPDDSIYLTTRLLATSPSGMKIAWVVERGDPNKIGYFVFKLSTKSGRKLIDAKIKRKARTLSLTSLRPNSPYTVTITAHDEGNEALAESALPIVTQSKNKPAGSLNPRLYFEANEIRGDQLRLIWAVQDVGNVKISGFRLRVLDEGPDFAELLTRKILPNRTNFLLQNIPPNRNITIFMDALRANQQPLLTSALSFVTPSPGSSHQSVVGSSNPQSSRNS